MRKNEIYNIEITGMTDDGNGVGRIDGMAVFVPYTLIGEYVRILIIKVLKNYAAAKLLEVITPSAERTAADCAVYNRCGGCGLRHMSYKAELEFKRQKVTDCMRRIAGIDCPEVGEVIPADNIYHYRNKSQFPVTPDGIGMYAAHSHRLIKTPGCLIASPDTDQITGAIREWMEKFSVPAYDEKCGRGIIRNIYTRSGDSGTLVTIVTAAGSIPHEAELISALKSCGANICGVVRNINTGSTNTLLGKENKTLFGTPYIIDMIGSVSFKISPHSFYQINKKQTLKLYTVAKEYAGLTGNETLLDVYCGIGTIGQFMADKAKRIIGIEAVPKAVENARENAYLNGIECAEYHCGKAENVINSIVKSNKDADTTVAVVDPPRKGCDSRLLDALCRISGLKKIVYISCKPSTLARDIKYMKAYGFAPEKITPVDMFPRTPHVETVCVLSKLKSTQHIEVDLNMDELDLTAAESKATYEEIKAYVRENYGFKVTALNIAQVKRKCGIIERENYNKPKSENTRQPQCPPEKETAITEALRHFGMI